MRLHTRGRAYGLTIVIKHILLNISEQNDKKTIPGKLITQ